MRIFTDPDGRAWDVVVGRESWGSIFAIFIPRDGDRDIRQAVLDATTYEAGTTELGGLHEEELRALLERSEPKPLG